MATISFVYDFAVEHNSVLVLKPLAGSTADSLPYEHTQYDPLYAAKPSLDEEDEDDVVDEDEDDDLDDDDELEDDDEDLDEDEDDEELEDDEDEDDEDEDDEELEDDDPKPLKVKSRR